MVFWWMFFVAAALCLGVVPVQSQTNETTTITVSADQLSAFHARIAAELQAANVRGAAYAFRGPGMDAPVLGTYGQISSADNAPAVTLDTVFSLASVSKPFTGAVVATLIDTGLLEGLDDDLCDSVFSGVRDAQCQHPVFPDTNVTWRMLVTHRSGLLRNPPVTADNIDVTYGPTGVYPETGGNDQCPLDDLVAFYEDLMVDQDTTTTVGQDGGYRVNWYDLAQDENPGGGVWNISLVPGQEAVYSNLGAAYVAALIERMTGVKFELYSKQAIFEPLGMNHTAWFRRDLPNNTLEAMPTAWLESESMWEDIGHYCWANYADGQLRSSITDMALWAEAHLGYGIDILWSNDTAMESVYGCQEEDLEGDRLDDLACEFSLNWEYLGPAKRDQKADTAAFAELDWTNGILHNGGELGVATEIMILPESGAYVMTLLNTEADVGYFQEGIAHEGMTTLLGRGAPGMRGFDAPAVEGDDDGGDDDGDDSTWDDSVGDDGDDSTWDDSVGDDDGGTTETSKTPSEEVEKPAASSANPIATAGLVWAVGCLIHAATF